MVGARVLTIGDKDSDVGVLWRLDGGSLTTGDAGLGLRTSLDASTAVSSTVVDTVGHGDIEALRSSEFSELRRSSEDAFLVASSFVSAAASLTRSPQSSV